MVETIHPALPIRGDAQSRFEAATRRFDAENARDPKSVTVNGESVPYEVFYAHRLTEWVLRLCPEASEPLRLASRCQHLCRWTIPRESYSKDRAGYLKWRADLKKFHAAKSGEILHALGYPPDIVERVRELNLKKNLGSDPEVQVLEDALCLVTLEHQLGDLMQKNTTEKMVGVLQKTWKKMSPAARETALTLSYTDAQHALIARALAEAAS